MTARAIFSPMVSLNAIAARNGFDYSPQDAIQLPRYLRLSGSGDVPAWQLGAKAAEAVRDQANLGCAPIPNKVLAELAGIAASALDTPQTPHASLMPWIGAPAAAALYSGQTGKPAAVSNWREFWRPPYSPPGDHLFPSTRAHTYRQMMQRSFAAELLSPFQPSKRRSMKTTPTTHSKKWRKTSMYPHLRSARCW